MDRRAFVSGLLAAVATTRMSRAQAEPATQATLIDVRTLVISKAEQLAAQAYRAPATPLPDRLRQLNYDDYHEIKFRTDRNFWRGDPGGFELQGMHRGFFFEETVALNLVENGVIRRLAYDPSLYSFGLLKDIQPSRFGDIGYSGLRLLTDVEASGTISELLVFQGASYFRAVARGVDYGLSARGLAIRTGDERGEEFPDFVEFFIEKPLPGAEEIRLHALLDGPSVTGAYSFTVRTGSATRMSVEATLFARVDLDNLGFAPLTSMYWYSPLERPVVDDFRPRIHDSDGLSMRAQNGEWLWRPIANPVALQRSQFDVGTPQGFGLAQRSRELRDFEDPQAKYHRRPSLWIEPRGAWPAGKVEMVEIPTRSEFSDNIVAYWRPAALFRAGNRLDYGYDMRWSARTPEDPRLLRVRESYSGQYAGTWRHFVIDFISPEKGQLPPPSALVADVSTSAGRIDGLAIIRYPEINGFRLTFRLVPEGPTANLRAVLRRGSNAFSETWIYRWTRRGPP